MICMVVSGEQRPLIPSAHHICKPPEKCSNNNFISFSGLPTLGIGYGNTLSTDRNALHHRVYANTEVIWYDRTYSWR